MSKYVTKKEFNEKILELQRTITLNLCEEISYVRDEQRATERMLIENNDRFTRYIDEMDKYKYRLTQKTVNGEIDHFFHEDREEQLIKLIRYCNERKIEYKLNDKAREFHNKLYNLILKGE